MHIYVSSRTQIEFWSYWLIQRDLLSSSSNEDYSDISDVHAQNNY